MSPKISRRDFLKFATAGAAGVILTSCTQSTTAPTPETIKVIETVLVEKEGQTVVETVEVIKEVTATPEPVVQEEVADVLGAFPRRETVIARILTGRVG